MDFVSYKILLRFFSFQFYVDPETKEFLPWAEIVPEFELDPELPLQVINILILIHF